MDLSSRDGKIKENWYIICLESELSNKPLSRIIYDEKLVVFKSKVGITVLKDKCLHRAAKLSEGTVKMENLFVPIILGPIIMRESSLMYQVKVMNKK